MGKPRRTCTRLTPLIPLEALHQAGFPHDFIEEQAANETFHRNQNDPTEPYSGVTTIFDADIQRLGGYVDRSEWLVLSGLEIERIHPIGGEIE